MTFASQNIVAQSRPLMHIAHMQENLPDEEHKARHVFLHKAADELLADWITQTGGLPSHPIMDLLHWSHEQTKNPTNPQ